MLCFGMPKEAIALGAVEKVVSPSQIVAAISAWSNTHTVRAAAERIKGH